MAPPAAAAHFSGTGPSWNAVPTIRSPRPRASSISVEVDLIVTTRCGGAAVRPMVVPQLSREVRWDGVVAGSAAMAEQPPTDRIVRPTSRPATGRRAEDGTVKVFSDGCKNGHGRSLLKWRVETSRLRSEASAPHQARWGGLFAAHSMCSDTAMCNFGYRIHQIRHSSVEVLHVIVLTVLTMWAVAGIGEIQEGDDLGALIGERLDPSHPDFAGQELANGDIVATRNHSMRAENGKAPERPCGSVVSAAGSRPRCRRTPSDNWTSQA